MVNDSPDSSILYYENRELELLKNAMNIEAKKRGERIAQNPVMKEIISPSLFEVKEICTHKLPNL